MPDAAYDELHKITLALRRLTSGEINRLQYDIEIANAHTALTSLANATNDKGDADNPLLLDAVRGAIGEGGEDSGTNEEADAFPPTEDTDTTDYARIREYGRNLGSG